MSVFVAFLLGPVLAVYLVVYLFSNTPRQAYPEELVYYTTSAKSKLKSGKLKYVMEDGEGSEDIELSVVVPSYNETGRISVMLTEAVEYLEESFPDKWEILIVDDGSQDDTSEYCLKLAKQKFKLKPDQLKVVKFSENRGKGGAVRHGMLHIRGKYGLFADADGASKFSDVEKLLDAMKETGNKNGSIAIGSRSHMLNTDAVVKRSFIRNIMMYGLHMLVYIFGIRSIGDTQCGFKLFDRNAVRQIFPYLHTEGWIFDVEILILALRKNIVIHEIPISWHEVGGSKMVLTRDSIKMAKDLVVIRLAYIFGIYGDKIAC
ncbi:dolichyl-phosphate beta-glucosyltransferase Ecym_2162 [Eremothecium cymbalariae DBVPG|uniref:dolichyl-phosphate beta-glucosyltransferase n=1 Tax=Eremothecium cymbalariae (strain CBS 270.75 / DBVPG 7215 / KCTC 17166 / NRRL Y-17582) TaxID=931890 RepID=G8JNJ8_ERECY|nr:Hypothetical protein Ecym_2162 [Eremothecium cymbalariae DBVPG\